MGLGLVELVPTPAHEQGKDTLGLREVQQERCVRNVASKGGPQREPSTLPQILNHDELVRLFTVTTNFKHRAVNQISDVSALAGLTALERLDLEHNQISSVSPLSGMTALEKLRLNDNRISSVSALAGMTVLDWAVLSDNQSCVTVARVHAVRLRPVRRRNARRGRRQ